MRLSTLARLGNALAIAGVVAVLGGLVTLAVLAIAGGGLIVGITVTIMASVGSAVWTYRAVRLLRTVARPVDDWSRGLVRP